MSSPAQDAALTLVEGALFAERYRVTRFIGKGGMGSVYEVVDERTDGVRAVKIMSASMAHSTALRARFDQESRIASRIESEHLVRIYDVGTEGMRPFIVMELLRGEDLESVLKRRRMEPSEALTYLRQVSRALERTHAANVVHRDIKPENLFLTQRDDGSGCIKVLDFGIAKVVDRTSQAHTRVVGTPLYMSPEQVEGVGEIGPAADLHALGHVAFTLLTGFPYWEEEAREGPMALMIRLMKGPIEAPSARVARRGLSLPAGFDAWFARATALVPADRFPTAREAIDALALLYGFGTDTGPSASQLAPTRGAATPAPQPDHAALASAETQFGGTPAMLQRPAAITAVPSPSSPMAFTGALPAASASGAYLAHATHADGRPGVPSSGLPAAGQTFAMSGQTVLGGPPPEALRPPPATLHSASHGAPITTAPAPAVAKPARKHSAVSLIAAGACMFLLAVAAVVIVVLGVQRKNRTSSSSTSSSAATGGDGSSSTERTPPCRSGNEKCKEIRQPLTTLEGAKLLEHAEMLAREIEKDAKLYQIDLEDAVYQGRVDAKNGHVKVMFGANGKAIVVKVVESELVANTTPNVSLPKEPLPRPTCGIANAWRSAIDAGLDGSGRLSMFFRPDRRGKAWQIQDALGKTAYVNAATCDPM